MSDTPSRDTLEARVNEKLEAVALALLDLRSRAARLERGVRLRSGSAHLADQARHRWRRLVARLKRSR